MGIFIFLVLGLIFLALFGVGVDMNIFAGIIIFGVIMLVFIAVFIVTNKNHGQDLLNNRERINKAFQKWGVEKLSKWDINIEDKKKLHTAHKYYILSVESDKFILIDYRPFYQPVENSVKDVFNEYVYDLSKIRKVSLKTNDQTVAEIQKENALGRAMVGGVLFGGAGAVVGSTSARQTQTETNTILSIKLEIVTKDIDNPYTTILLYDAEDSGLTDFEKMEHAIQNMYWSLENILTPTAAN